MINEITIVSTQRELDDIPLMTEEYKIKKLILVCNEAINQSDLENNPMLESIDVDILNLNVKHIDLEVTCSIISEFLIKEAENSTNDIVVKLSLENYMLNISLYYAACFNKDIIKSVLIFDNKLKKILHLPLFDYKLSEAKRAILTNIEDGKNTIEDIAEAVGRSNSMVYNHIRDLREIGLLEKDSLKLNNSAKILLSL